MSWLARSIANSLKLDDDDDDDSASAVGKPEEKSESSRHLDEDPSSPTSRGVKDDISELTKTLTRQFWGVASFLAPPPIPEQRSGSKNVDTDSAPGIRADFAEIGGKFRSAISQLSSNPNVTEITKMASNFLQLGSDEEEERWMEGFEGAVGVTEEVVVFVRDLIMHPETWLDFPIVDEHDVDFDLSDAQQEHALAVERLIPRLTALRIELCPGYMSENSFWKIYFVLLHPVLDEEDAELLSTPQIIKARALLSQELKTRTAIKPENEGKESVYPDENTKILHVEPLSMPTSDLYENNNKESDLEISTSVVKAASGIVKHPDDINEIEVSDPEIRTSMERPASETVNHPGESNEIQILNNSGPVKDQSSKSGSENILVTKDEDDADDWLKEENSEIGGAGETTIPIENDEDVSFSDLEEDDDVEVPATYRKSSSSSDKDSRDWVQIE